MPTTIALVVVVGFSFIVSWAVRRYLGQRSPLTGVEHLLLGFAVGPRAAAVVSARTIAAAQPLLSTAMGLIGFTIGLPLRRRLADSPARLQVGLTTAVIACAAVGALIYGLVDTHELISRASAARHGALWLALAIGAAACATSEDSIEAVISRTGARGPASDLLSACAQSGNLLAVGVSGFALAVARARAVSGTLHLTQTEWLVSSVVLGVVCGVLFRAFVGGRNTDGAESLFLATVGVVVFASGMAAGLGMSPLLITAIAGLVVSLLSRAADDLYHALAPLKRPVEVVVVIFAGASWEPPAGAAWLMPAAYLLVRTLALRIGAAVGQAITPELGRVHRLGQGLSAQGVLAAAIALNFAQVNPQAGKLALGAVLPCLLLSDALAVVLLRRTLADAGETGRVGPASGESANGAAPGVDDRGNADDIIVIEALLPPDRTQPPTTEASS